MTAHRRTARAGEAARFDQPKVLVKDTTKDFACTYEGGEYYVKYVLIVFHKKGVRAYDLKVLAGIINSNALRFYYRSTFKTLHVQNKELTSLPLPALVQSKKEDVSSQERLTELVTQMLKAQSEIAQAMTEAETSYLSYRILMLDRNIDDLVCRMYGLDTNEIKLIELKLTEAAQRTVPRLIG